MNSNLNEKIKEVKELRDFYLEGIDYVRTHVIWILDNYKKYGIKVDDIDKLLFLYNKSSKLLDKFPPTE